MADELGVTCEVANPFRNVDISDVPEYSQEELQAMAPSLMVVIGLALRQIV